MITPTTRFWCTHAGLLFAVCCILCAGFSCGYAVYGRASLPFREIRIAGIENTTDEPKLQDKLIDALTDELLRQGITVNSRSDYSVSGKIKLFELRILAEASDVATEYEILMKGDFSVVDGEGKVREFKDIGSPFFITFSGSAELTSLLAFKQRASERAIRDMAQQIVAALMYR